MSPCTADDMARFYPSEERSLAKIQNLFEKQALYCIEEQLYDIDLYGNWVSDSYYSALDIMLIPCATRYTAYDGTVHGGGDNCNWNKTEAMNYLGGAINLI